MTPPPASSTRASAIEAFKKLWQQSSSPPDLPAFLRQQGMTSGEPINRLVRIDLACRHRAGYDVPAREYIRLLAPTTLDETLVGELVAAEIRQHRLQGKEPRREEFCAGLPDGLASAVQRHWQESEVHVSTHVPHSLADTVAPGEEPSHGDAEAASLPEFIGRYRVLCALGAGGFGVVYRARDEELHRDVAVKVPHERLIRDGLDVKTYLSEARVVARLDHPHIVPVLDAGRSEDGSCYVVYKYIEGRNLSQILSDQKIEPVHAVRLILPIARALCYTHAQGIVHRDIKPANILIDAQGAPILTDFGLALREGAYGDDQPFSGSVVVGTPAYMSPEQARGEGHRIDGRTDMFSLGVVFYLALTGRRPFAGATREEVLENICNMEARPLRQFNPDVPRELERICLRMLAKRTSERYLAVVDVVDDLEAFLCQVPSARVSSAILSKKTEGTTGNSDVKDLSGSQRTPLQVIPKGLRSFDAEDADFFLQLLPGPRDRQGLPEGIRFWRSRFEERDLDRTFAVGVLYGPSGCGKSSLMLAGILPRLATHVTVVYVEATPDETESRLLRGLRKACPDLPAELSLSETVATIRRQKLLGAGQKLVMVIDQFEQWLHARLGETRSTLIDAFRQADGVQVQAAVMVRDDFWIGATQFMRELDLRILDGQNAAMVELFDLRHARRVLEGFGKAFGAVAEGGPDRESAAFVETAARELSQNGRVVPVRLALFAEMVKDKPWTPATLRALGGAAGTGVQFLEETLGDASSRRGYRAHQRACRSVLRRLMPESGAEIKGHMRSRMELLAVTGCEGKPEEFGEIMRILDHDLRLITLTDPEATVLVNSEEQQQLKPGGYYQLAHDYLVPSIREWLAERHKSNSLMRWCREPARASQAALLTVGSGILNLMIMSSGVILALAGLLATESLSSALVHFTGFAFLFALITIAGLYSFHNPRTGLLASMIILLFGGLSYGVLLCMGYAFGGIYTVQMKIVMAPIYASWALLLFVFQLLAYVGIRANDAL